jgi:capsular exopolysaccharide synthesis family protein
MSGSEKSPLVIAEDAKSSGAESFRSLRTSLSMLGREEQRRVFLLTSALPQEGKTFCSLNYAASLAQSGLRTVVIDCDLRRPSVEKILTGKRSGKPGVTDFLTGKTGLPDLIQPTEIEKLSFISAGTVAPNPAELLTRNSIDALVDDALQQFERVVIDSAPIHAVSDTLLILNRVQTVCLVGRACKTPRKSILRALQILQKAHAPMAGVILNRLPRRRGLEYYYDSYYDYSYRGKYSEKGVYGEA